jgi:hypothetical protein
VRQEFLMLAEAAEAASGKIFIHGGCVERHHSARFPTQLRADIALSVLVPWGETNQTHVMTLCLVDEDQKEVLKVESEFVAGRPPTAKPAQDLRQLIAIKGPFPIKKPGAYKLVMTLDSQEQEPPFRFWVEEAQPR